MKKQCNLCGLRNDTVVLVQKKRTWCLVYDKEVDNKQAGCDYWKPGNSSVRNDKNQIATEIKRSIREQIDGKKRVKIESERHAEAIKQQILNRESAEKRSRKVYVTHFPHNLI